MINWLAEFHHVALEVLMPSIYIHEEQAAVKHLMRVSCGLDSLVLGEPQILGQVKKKPLLMHESTMRLKEQLKNYFSRISR